MVLLEPLSREPVISPPGFVDPPAGVCEVWLVAEGGGGALG